MRQRDTRYIKVVTLFPSFRPRKGTRLHLGNDLVFAGFLLFFASMEAYIALSMYQPPTFHFLTLNMLTVVVKPTFNH